MFAFGLVVLELTTMKRLDHSNSYGWPELLESVKDEVCTLCRFRAYMSAYIAASCRAATLTRSLWLRLMS